MRVRLYNHKSKRHYGGRIINSTNAVCNAKLIRKQEGIAPYIVELQENCEGYQKGRIIAVREKDYNV